MASASAAVRGIRGAALVGGKILDDVLIGIDPSGVGKIVSVARARSGSALAARARRVEGLIVPGYVDVHLHGAGGHDVLGPGGAQALLMASRGMKSPERDIVAALRGLAVETAKHGYAAILPATVSLPVESLRLWVRAVGVARAEQHDELLRGRARDEAIILGANSEGPSISHARKGAHDPVVLISGADLNAECQAAITNRQVAGIETVFILTSEKYAYASSSLIRQIAAFGGSMDTLTPFVPDRVQAALRTKLDDPSNPLGRLRAEQAQD